jgi:hypothetical protein
MSAGMCITVWAPHDPGAMRWCAHCLQPKSQKSLQSRMRNKNRGEKITNKELKDRWAAASPATKHNAKQKATQLIQRGPHLIEEITQQLQVTRGRITWRGLAAQVAGDAKEVAPFCHVTVQTFVMGLPNSEYSKTYIHPKLTIECKQRRFDWVRAFYMFWEAAIVLARGVQVVLIHMDEKWF